MTRFVILAAPRSGTNRLVEQLCAQPDVWCHGEVLKKGKVPIKRHDPQLKEELLDLRERDFDAFLRRIFELSKERPHCGIKVFFGHLDEQRTPAILDDADILKVVLSRPNLLACYSSSLAARENGAWNPVQMANAERPLVRFKEAAFQIFYDKTVNRYRALSERLAAQGQIPFSLHTHELNDQTRISALLAFLGAGTDVVEPDVPSSRGPPDILSRFSNPGVVERYLREHDLMQWAEEVPRS